MIKRIALIITLIAFSAPAFAGLEDTYGYAQWTEAERGTGHATFAVGNATNSYTSWLAIPADSEWAAVQILSSTSASATYYRQGVIADSARISGTITNASFVVELSPLTVSSATPPTASVKSIPVFDIIASSTSTGAAPGDAFGPKFLWNDYNASSVPLITRYGLYRIPIRGENVMRIRFTRSGVSVAYQWVVVHFNKR